MIVSESSDNLKPAKEFLDTLNDQRQKFEGFLAEHGQRAKDLHSQLLDELSQQQEHSSGPDQQYDDLLAELESLRSENSELCQQAEQASGDGASDLGLLAELESLRSENNDLRQHAEQASGDGASDLGLLAEMESLQSERERLASSLEASENRMAGLITHLSDMEEQVERLQQQAELGSGSSGDEGEYQRRYEMALDDVRDLKGKNQRLMSEVEEAKKSGNKGGGGGGSDADANSMDWEAQKRRLLASLDDFDDGSEEQKDERIKIEEVVNSTSQMLQQKERELDELRHLLEQQSSNIGAVAVGAAALGEMFDQDELITEERASLKQLQDEWRQKLSKAEIELSMERAKLGRERVDIEEKLRLVEQNQTRAESHGTGGAGNSADDGSNSIGGRWLAKLGLRDKDV